MIGDSTTNRFAIFEQHLAAAGKELLKRRRKLILSAAVGYAATAGLPFAALGMLGIFCHVAGWISLRTSSGIFGGFALVWIAFLAWAFWKCRTAKVGLIDAAERMDLASGSKNRFASALEFRETYPQGGLAELAIDDALHHAESANAFSVTLPNKKRSRRFIFDLTGTAICLLLSVLAIILISPGSIPNSTVTREIASGRRLDSESVAALPKDVANKIEIPPDDLRMTDHQFKAINDQQGISTSGTSVPISSQPAPKSMAASGSASPSNAANSPGASQSPSAGVPSLAVASSDPQHSPPAAIAMLPEAGGDAQPSNQATVKGTQSSSGLGEDLKVAGTAGDQQQSKTLSDDKNSSRNAREASMTGGTSANQRTDSGSTGHNARGAENTESTGGHGSGQGQSGAKKSRGAGSTLLGVRMPDRFKGQEQPGPEQQTYLPADPAHGEQAPAPPANSSDRRGDELPSDMTHIDPADDGLVNEYFLHLHDGK